MHNRSFPETISPFKHFLFEDNGPYMAKMVKIQRFLHLNGNSIKSDA